MNITKEVAALLRVGHFSLIHQLLTTLGSLLIHRPIRCSLVIHVSLLVSAVQVAANREYNLP
jgi:hypothetical protein